MLLASSAVVVQVFSLRFSVLVQEDFDAVIDTINVLAWICLLLVGMVFLLNLISLIKNRNKPGQKKIT